MALPLTPELLRATYDFLRQTPPFNRWKLDSGDDVRFSVTRSRKIQGDHLLVSGVHTIRVSSRKNGNTHTLVELMAHKMVHAACDRGGVRSEHGKEFQRRAALVCKYHGFDPMSF